MTFSWLEQGSIYAEQQLLGEQITALTRCRREWYQIHFHPSLKDEISKHTPAFTSEPFQHASAYFYTVIAALSFVLNVLWSRHMTAQAE